MKKRVIYTIIGCFIALNIGVNTSFGELPTLSTLQKIAENNATTEKTPTTGSKTEEKVIEEIVLDDGNKQTITSTTEQGLVIDMKNDNIENKKDNVEVKQIKQDNLDAQKQKEEEEKTQKSKAKQEQINKTLAEKVKMKKQIPDEEMGKLITTFDLNKALDYNYDTIKYINGGFLENASEFRVLKQTLKEQINPELKKKKDEEEAKKKSLAEAIKKGKVEKPFNGIHLTSLLFVSGDEWVCRINSKVIKSENRNKKGSNFSIVKVNKTSIVFLLKKTTKTMIKQVETLIEKKYPYYQNYFITEENDQQHIGVKLFVGQTIDFDTMRIIG